MGEIGRSFPNAPFKTYQQALDCLNHFHWNLKVTQEDGRWYLHAGSGEVGMFNGDSSEELEAFVLGMALTFSMILPEGLPGFEP